MNPKPQQITQNARPEGRRLATCPRGDSEELRLELSEYEGRPYISLRVWFQTEDGKWLPSKKGCTIRLRELPEVLRALADPELQLAGGTRVAHPKPSTPNPSNER